MNAPGFSGLEIATQPLLEAVCEIIDNNREEILEAIKKEASVAVNLSVTEALTIAHYLPIMKRSGCRFYPLLSSSIAGIAINSLCVDDILGGLLKPMFALRDSLLAVIQAAKKKGRGSNQRLLELLCIAETFMASDGFDVGCATVMDYHNPTKLQRLFWQALLDSESALLGIIKRSEQAKAAEPDKGYARSKKS